MTMTREEQGPRVWQGYLYALAWAVLYLVTKPLAAVGNWIVEWHEESEIRGMRWVEAINRTLERRKGASQ